MLDKMNLVANGNKSKHKKPKKNLVLFGTIFTFPRIWQFLKHYKLGHFIKHKALISDEWFTYHVYWILSWMQKTTIKFWKLAGFLMAEYCTQSLFLNPNHHHSRIYGINYSVQECSANIANTLWALLDYTGLMLLLFKTWEDFSYLSVSRILQKVSLELKKSKK